MKNDLLSHEPSDVFYFETLYTAFDRYPLPKGATRHIQHMAKCLFQQADKNLLFVQGDPNMPYYQKENLLLNNRNHHVEIRRAKWNDSVPTNNILHKAIQYMHQLRVLLAKQGQQLKLAQFRDPWGGVPLVEFKSQNPDLKLVYEVNALPSLELPIHFQIPEKTIHKIQHYEQTCLGGADIIITPSLQTQQLIQGKTKTPVIYLPNGADNVSVDDLIAHKLDAKQNPVPRLIYFGAAQKWQGLDDLLKAAKILASQINFKLHFCLSLRNRQAKRIEKLVTYLELGDYVEFDYGLPQDELNQKIIQATASVAPLTPCQRNLIQGCCPIKIIESMACATPVIASDLPVVRELIHNPSLGVLVYPNRPSELARACLLMLTAPQQAHNMGKKAQAHILANFSWAQIEQDLTALYQTLTQESQTQH